MEMEARVLGFGGEMKGLKEVAVVLVAMAATMVWWLLQKTKAERKSGLPGDWGWPFLGETLNYVATMKSTGSFVDLKAKR